MIKGNISWMFYIPLAFFFHPACFFLHDSLNTLAQFWFHTELLGSLGPLEYILNTPSHHRYHHRPPGNGNYGAVLIIWDRMFGTFQFEETHTDHYGLAKQYTTFDPVYANFGMFCSIYNFIYPCFKKNHLFFINFCIEYL